MTSAPPPVEQAPNRAGRVARVVTVVLVALGLVTAHQMGVLHLFAEPARVKATLVDLGAWGYVAFVVAYALLQPFGVPGMVFVLAAPLIWPWPVAFALSMAGTLTASAVGFSFARFIARDWAAKRVPARFRAYDEALARRGFVTVVVLRAVFWMAPVLHAFFGVSRVSFWTHLAGSAAGLALPLLLIAYFGAGVLDAVRGAPPWTWVAAAVAVVLVAGLVGLVTRGAGRRAAETRSGDP